MSTEQLALVKDLVHVLEHINDTRYLSAAGFVVLLYDHFLTLDDEIKYVWRAPASLPKLGFLFNRYLVLACLLAVACEMCGFSIIFTDTGCMRFLFTMSMFGIVSVGIASVLVLHRVVILWEHRPLILKLMSFGFLSGFIVQVVTMILANIRLSPTVSWSPVAKMCIVTGYTHLYIAVWAAPMLFEVLVLIFTIINALDRPRTAQTRLTSVLHADGVAYFVALTVLRALNLAMAATTNSSLTLLSVFFVWAMTTTVLNRSLLNLREVEVTGAVSPISGRASPFGRRNQDNGVHIVDLDDITLCWDPERQNGEVNGHKASESVGSSTKLLRLDSLDTSGKRGSQDSDWFPKI